MQYKLLQPDGSLVNKAAGCWGALGRSDFYRLPPAVRKAMAEHNKKGKNTIPYKDSSSEESFLMKYSNTIAVVLTPEDGWGALFHKSAYSLMEYIVERSPFKVTFPDGYKWEDCYKNNKLHVYINLCPAQITSTLLIWLRDVLKSNKYARTFDFVCSLGYHEGVAFCTALHHPYLYSMVIQEHGVSREAFQIHAVDFWMVDSPTVQHWKDNIPLFDMTMAAMGGYPVNMTEQWYLLKGEHKPKYGVARPEIVKISGLFGVQEVRGVPDAKKFINNFWGFS